MDLFASLTGTSSRGRPIGSSRGYVDLMDASLTSVEGAQVIINHITSQSTVTKLILGHNHLGDAGCLVLFRFLASPAGRVYPIAEISLNANEIGDKGLLALAGYLKGNVHLRELFLQNNLFGGDATTMRMFAAAINKSKLVSLSLTTNSSLSDTFAASFFPSLDATALRELHISAVELTRLSVSPMVDFITSRRCRLTTLKCNGNNLGYEGVTSLTKAIDRFNYSLTSVELLSNQCTEEEDIPRDDWMEAETALRDILIRNSALKPQLQKEAVQLLHYARQVLLYPSKTSLPPELLQHILSFVAPYLSLRQRINVFNYASAKGTLPALSVRERAACVSSAFSTFGTLWRINDDSTRHDGNCASCSGSLVCRREVERQRWLDQVDCASWDPHLGDP